MTPARRPHPSIPAVVFGFWWVVASIVFPDRMINADGDMLRHVRHGEYMLVHGGLIHADPFSFTRAGDPFVAFEYGSQVVYALVHRAAGLAGVAIFAGLLIATAYALLARFLLSRGVDGLLTYLVSFGAAMLGAVHWSPRPHLFTLVAVIVVLGVLEEPVRTASIAVRVRRLIVFALFFALWANLHGGFVFGFVLIGIYCVGSLGEAAIARRRGNDAYEWRARAGDCMALGIAALAGTFLTPNGMDLHRHIIAFFGEPFLMENTQEFLSPDFHTAVGKLLLVALAATVVVLALAPQRPDLRRLLLIVAMVYFALDARRNIQLFGVMVLPILALQYDGLWRRLPERRGRRAAFDGMARTGRTIPYVAMPVMLFAVLAMARGRLAGSQVVPNRLDPTQFPIDVVARARSAGLTGRIFHDFVWGGYILYAWPEQKVFIDGGTDFYGTELMATHMAIAGMQRGWRDSLESWRISHVLMPTGVAMIDELARDGTWRLRDCDRTATLLERVTTASGRNAGDVRQCAKR